MKRLIWLLLLVSTVGCTSVKATPSVDTSKQDLEFEMALQESFKTSHQEEMTAIQSQADILARIEESVALLKPSGTSLDATDEENGTKPAETNPNTSEGTLGGENDESKSTEPTETDEDPIQPIPEENTDDYVVMFTAPDCLHCVNWKKRELRKLEKQGIKFTEVNVRDVNNAFPSQRNISLPLFWTVDGTTGAWNKPFQGYTSGETLIHNVRIKSKSKTTTQKAVTTNPCSSLCTCGCNSGEACNCNVQSRTYYLPQRLPVVRTQWGTIDLQTYHKNCNCPMCRGIRGLQQQYQNQPVSIPATVPTTDTKVREFPPQEPTPQATLNRMIDLLELTEKDTLADLGCGDGRVLIEAVRRFDCTAIGVEIDPVKAEIARKKVEEAGLDSKIEIITGDALDFEPSEYDVTALTTYLYPDLLAKLKPKFDSVRIGASPFHQVPGLVMTNHDDVWIYQPSI